MKSINTIPEISNSAIIEQILNQTGQFDISPLDLKKIDELLKVNSYDFDFNKFKKIGEVGEQLELRGILDIKASSIFLDENEKLGSRKRFSHAHEIGHYLIPSHRDYLYQCTESDMNPSTLQALEREANQFASELLFKGPLFYEALRDIDTVSFHNVGEIAKLFNVSFVASLRKVVSETNQPAAMVIVSEKNGSGLIDYTIGSESMRDNYFRDISNIPSLAEIIKKSKVASRHDPHRVKLRAMLSNGEKVVLGCQFYYNGYQHVGLICPEKTADV